MGNEEVRAGNGEVNVREHLVPLEPLDLSKCESIGDIVSRMARCSFGARMLGEVAETLTGWTTCKQRPALVFDGKPKGALFDLLREMGDRGRGWFVGPYTSEEWLARAKTQRFLEGKSIENMLVVGNYAERTEDDLYASADRIVFINKEYRFKPGQAGDGFFPDVVFGDPNVILPILSMVLCERTGSPREGVGALIKGLEAFDGSAREVVHGAHTLRRLLCDKDTTMMFTLSGAMTIAKMQLVIDDLLKTGRVKYLAATGALMAHGLVEGSGAKHFKHNPAWSDDLLAAQGLNRVTDTIEPEENFDQIEEIVSAVLEGYNGRKTLSSSIIHRDIGKYLVAHHPEQRAVLKTAYEMGIPIVTPAVVDSELANDIFVNNARRKQRHQRKLVLDQERDTQILFDLATSAKKLGIFTIGGGVPRNNTQNVAPLIEIFNNRMGTKLPGGQFFYACRIDPASMFLGNLGGCTYREGVSWRKFVADGFLAEVRMDATIAWPFIQQFALEEYRLAA